MSDIRDEFEEWYDDKYLPDHECLSDTINDDAVWSALKEAAWKAWVASRQSPAERLAKRVWDIELMYKHRGERKPRFLNLGQSFEPEREEALDEGRDKAEEWLGQQFKGNEIESWEVKVRPAKQN